MGVAAMNGFFQFIGEVVVCLAIILGAVWLLAWGHR